MEALKYKVIKDENQYNEYCKDLRQLLLQNKEEASAHIEDQIELLTLLIEKWDEEHNTMEDRDPIEILKALMKEHKMKSVELAKVLGISKSLVSSIINYRRGLSKENIRKLAEYFKLSQEAFNRPYKLVSPLNKRIKHGSVMNSKKDLTAA